MSAALFLSSGFAATNVIEYTRDAAGNITGISRQASSVLAITGFSPSGGLVGTTVTIYGAAFSATPANNTVTFNGTAATVSASSSGSIATTVPAGATTGRIAVTVGGTTVTSAVDFVVAAAGTPTITAFSPASGVATTSVSVMGTNFDTSATTVKLNGVTASASVGSTTALSFPIPAAAASGRITATTSVGTAASANDLVVAPSGVAAADIVVVKRVALDGVATYVAMGSANKHALVLFDAAQDGYYSVQFTADATSPTTATIPYKVIAPDNSVIQTGTVGNTSRPSIHLPKAPLTGTYSILLSPGIATLATNVRAITNPTLVIDGASGTTTSDFAFQSNRFVFAAGATQRLSIGMANLAFTPTATTPPLYIKVYNPDGSQLSSSSCNGPQVGNPQGNCDTEITTTVAGTYWLVTESPSNGYGNGVVQVSSEVTGSLTADSTFDVNLARQGQDANLTFTATAGDSVGLDVSGYVPQPQAQTLAMVVYRPNGTALITCNLAPPAPSYCELGPLPDTGTYKILIDPLYGAYGTFKLTVKQGAMLTTATSPTAFAPPAVPEAARFRVTTTAGQNLTVGVSDLAYVGAGSITYLNIYRADRSTLAGVNCNPSIAGGRCKVTLTNVPAGTYGIVLSPPQGVKMSGNIVVSDDLTGTLVAGTAQSLDATRAGQNARFSFAGTTGDSTSIKLFGVATTPANQYINVTVYSPSGGFLASTAVLGSGIINLPSLAATGTYKVVVEPQYGITWQGQLMLDPGALVTIDGSAATLATSAAGEVLRLRVSGTSGQRLDFGLSGLAASANPTYMSLYQPNGTSVMGPTCLSTGTASCEASAASLPVTGTYSAIFTPPTNASITAGSVYFSTPLSGTIVIGDPAQTIAITRAGQTARYTFAGTSGQLLRLNWSSTAVAGSATVAVSVLKPDGNTLSSGSFANAATGGFDIASLPTTGTYTVVLDPSAAATMTAPIAVVTR